MKLLSRARIAQPRAMTTTTHALFAIGVTLFSDAVIAAQPPAAAAQGAVIARGSGAKSAAREAKRAERAAAREAKRKERAERASHSDDKLAKAKSSKKSSGSSVDLGDNDPLDGL